MYICRRGSNSKVKRINEKASYSQSPLTKACCAALLPKFATLAEIWAQASGGMKGNRWEKSVGGLGLKGSTLGSEGCWQYLRQNHACVTVYLNIVPLNFLMYSWKIVSLTLISISKFICCIFADKKGKHYYFQILQISYVFMRM